MYYTKEHWYNKWFINWICKTLKLNLLNINELLNVSNINFLEKYKSRIATYKNTVNDSLSSSMNIYNTLIAYTTDVYVIIMYFTECLLIYWVILGSYLLATL